MDERLVGSEFAKLPRFSLAGEPGSRSCQKRRGDAMDDVLNGDDPAGEGGSL